MLLVHSSNTWISLGLIGLSLVGYQVVKLKRRSRWVRQKEKSLNCGKVKIRASYDPFFNLDHFIKAIRDFRRNRLLDFTKHLFEDYQTWTIKSKVLGQDIYFTADPENVKALLSLNFKSYGIGEEREANLGSLLGKGIFTSDGEAWKHSRSMLRPSFVRSELADLDIFEPHVQALIQNIETDDTIDLQPLFSVFTLDVATEFLLGQSTGCLIKGDKAADGVAFAEAFDRCRGTLSGEGRFGILSLWLPSHQYGKDVTAVQRFVDSFIDRRLSENPKKLDPQDDQIFLHRLMSETDDKVTIRTEILNILLAGRDTTAATLTNIWFCIAKYPSVLRRLRMEIASFVGKAPELAELKDLRYLRAVINESLRLHVIVPENSRRAREDTTLPRGGGANGDQPIFIPKGDFVGWSIYTMHRRKDIFGADAEDFRPERWLDAENETPLRPGWAYLPFSGGPRVCIGQQFALIEISYTIVRMLQTFSRIESKDEQPWTEHLLLTCSNRNGCKVKLAK